MILYSLVILTVTVLFREPTQHQRRFSCQARKLVCCWLDANRIKAFALGKAMIVMQRGICVFTMNVGDIFFVHLLRRKNARDIIYGDGKARQTRHSIGAVLGDQRVHFPYHAYIAYFQLFIIFCIFCIFRNSIK